MRKLHIITGFLFMGFITNCIGIDNDKLQENYLNYWSRPDDIEIQKIQKLIHGNYDNDKFEVISKPIRLDELAHIVMSFINGKESEAYVIIGLEEYMYHYRNMSETEFNSLPIKENGTKEDGIYRITSNDNTTKYYQIIDNKTLEIHLKAHLKNFFRKKLSKMKDHTDLTLRECNTMFEGIIEKSQLVNSNKILPIDTPIKVGINTDKEKRMVNFINNKFYIEALKKYISNNTSPRINFDSPYIKDTYIKPDGENEIIILKIKPHEELVVQDNNTKMYYGRARYSTYYKNNKQNNYGSTIMNKEEVINMFRNKIKLK